MKNIIKEKVKSLKFFIKCVREAYREQRVTYHLEKNTKKIKMTDVNNMPFNPNELSDFYGNFINYSPLVLGYADIAVLYRHEAALALGKFLNKKIEPAEMILSGLEHKYPCNQVHSVFFSTVWLYQNAYFVELGTSLGKKRSKIGFLDQRMYEIKPLAACCTTHAVIITYYDALPYVCLYYTVKNHDIKPLSLVRYCNETHMMTEEIEVYGNKISYKEILKKAQSVY